MADTQKLMILSLMLLLTPWLCAAVELLMNGDFESGVAGGWKGSGCVIGGTGQAHGGKAALLAHRRTEKWNGPGQYLKLSQVKSGNQYLFSAYVKLMSNAALSDPQVLLATIRYTFTDGSKDEYQTIARLTEVNLDKWIPIRVDFIMKDYGKSLKTAFLYVEGPVGSINIILDDASLTTLGAGSKGSTLSAAEEKIESIRKGNLTISIFSDKPLNDVEVKFEQLRHEFGFGTAVSADYLQTNAAYRQWYLDNFEREIVIKPFTTLHAYRNC